MAATGEFDKSKITTEPAPWNETDVRVRYDGEYAGVVQLEEPGLYGCAVNVQRKGHQMLQAIGQSSTLEQGAEDVAYQWWLRRTSHDPERPRHGPRSPPAP